MKLLRTAGLAALLFLLAGCASIAPGPSASSDDPASTPTPAREQKASAAPATGLQRPVYPQGELTPITAHEPAQRSVTALTPPGDLWDRIRSGFAMPDLDSPLVPGREQWYA
ncbi:MAG: lytic transglycosylase, partial [Curvibacter sp.]